MPTYAPHGRVVMSGEIGGTAERFSMAFAVAEDATLSLDPGFELSDERMDDLAADCSAWFGSVNARICNNARLTQVKFSRINSQGRLAGSPLVRPVNTLGNAPAATFGYGLPWQVATKATFLTAGDLGRVKGGFYIPCPVGQGFDPATNRWSVEAAETVRTSLDTFIEAVNNQPGVDNQGFVVVVASAGRHNPDGSTRVPPANHPVTAVRVGRRPDIIRRRANKVAELPTASVEIAGN